MKYLVTHFDFQGPRKLWQTARDLLADAVAEAGYEAFEETPEGLDGYVQEVLFDETEMRNAVTTLPVEGIKVSYRTETVADRDWNAAWEAQGFAPMTVEDTILVYDARHTPDPHPGVSADHIEIGIDAVQAFGSGQHATTRMMLAGLLHLDLRGKQVLDCGCGTGILGIAALKMGAAGVTAYDIDEWSVENARHNAVINGVDGLEVLHGDAHVLDSGDRKFEVVAANINRNILWHDLPVFRSVLTGPQSRILLSGFYTRDIPVLLQRAEELGLTEEDRQTEGDWAHLTLHSSSSKTSS